MIYDDPLDFDVAEKYIRDKVVALTSKGSAELAELPAEIRARALFSAKTLNADLLSGYQREIDAIVSGQSNVATTRAKMKDLIDELGGLEPEPGKEGSIEDLGSNKRIGLVIQTNVQMARGFGQFVEGISPGALDAYPALELIRVEDRHVPREWIEIWDNAAEELGDETTATDAEETGRMVAVKGDKIWLAISDFDQPYPPFKFNSGMGVEDVSYEDALDLGVIEDGHVPTVPIVPGFNDGVQAGIADVAADLVPILADSLQGLGKLVGNYFEMVVPKPSQAANVRAEINAVLAVLANMGTTPGAYKGWETRRRRIQIKQGREAIRRALASGYDQNNAMQVPGLGSVDFVHGRPGSQRVGRIDDGYGVAHVAAQHPDLLMKTPRTLAKGVVRDHPRDPAKKLVIHGNHIAVLLRQGTGRYSLVTHYADAEQARRWAGLFNTRQVSAGNLTSANTNRALLSDASVEGCCQDLDPIRPAELRQCVLDSLAFLEDAA